MTTTPQIKDKTEYAYAKSNIYQLLSTAFAKELTHESIEIFRGNDIAETLKNFGEGFDTEFYKCTTENVLKELSDEYAALFILPGGVNPTESVARAGLYMQVYAAQVLRFYHQCGFSLSDGFKGFPDHIGIELEFMSQLSKNEAVAYENGAEDEAKKWIELQKKFLEEHLAQWAMGFAKNVAAYAAQSFYRGMAHLLYAFISAEAKEFVGGKEHDDGEMA